MRRLAVWTIALGVASAQQAPPPANAAVSGLVKDASNGQPLANYNVSTYVNVTWAGNTLLMGQGKQVKSVTDDQGRYRIPDLPPGPYRITARNAEGFPSMKEKWVQVAGQDLDGIDFLMQVDGTISGKVVDENKEPVPGVWAYLVSREYYSGVLGYFIKQTARTDDRGDYTLHRVEPGQGYLIMVDRITMGMPAHSETPLDPRLRRRAPMRTFYPNSPAKEGAAPVVVRAGEHREGVNIEIKHTQNYCISGTIQGPAGPGVMNFEIAGAQPAFGQSNNSGTYGVMSGGRTGPDGKFRICDLSPGEYRLSGFDRYSRGPNDAPVNYALLPISIQDQDLTNLRLVVSPGMQLEGELALDGPQPEQPISGKVNISLTPLLRPRLSGEFPNATAEIPGTFSLTGLMPLDYGGLRVVLRQPGLYVKDARYSTESVLYAPLHMGSAPAGSTLRILVGQDGAKFTAHVSGKNSAPAPDIGILAFPADVSSEAMLQAAISSGQTNQMGDYTSQTLAPGKYLVGAVEERVDATPESIGRLWRARNRFTEVTLAPGGSARVELELLRLD